VKEERKLTPHIITAGTFVIFIIFGLACATAPSVQGVYYNEDGSTFTQNFYGSAPSSITNDVFLQSEIVNRYRTNVAQTYREARSTNTQMVDNDGRSTGHSASYGRLYQIVETYEITVTRHWYTRTTYYQDRRPTYSQVYQDEETSRLINTRTEYLD